IEPLVDAEGPAEAHLPAGLRQHDVARRIARGFADALQKDEHRRRRPATHDGQQRDGSHLHHVTDERDRPVQTAAVGQPPRYEAQRVAEKLPESRDAADDESTGAQRTEKGARYASGPLVCHVGKEIDDTEQQYEVEGGPLTELA